MFKLNKLKSPGVIIFLSSTLSFVGWLIMSEKMFYTLKKPFSIFSFGVFLAFIWYFLAIIEGIIGFQIGKKIKFKTSILDRYVSLRSDTVYKIIIFLAFFGITYSFYVIIDGVGGIGEVINLVKNNQANYLKKNLYKDYSIGIRSLRYVSVHAASLAIIRRIVFKKRNKKLDILALTTLLLCALISSRLSIIVTILEVVLILVIYEKIKLKKRYIIIGASLFYLIISTFNYTRNYKFYNKHGGMNFFEAGAADMIVYLGTPFQGAVSIGENASLIKEEPLNWHKYAGIPQSLTTNSTFLYFFRDYGWYAFLVSAFFVLVYSILAGIFLKFKNNILILVYTSIMYIFAEFWRVYLFYEGIMLTLIFVPIIITIFVMILQLVIQYYKNAED